MADLRVSGWGPFRMPGEKARLRRIEENVARFMASSSAAPAGRSQPAAGRNPATAEHPPAVLAGQDRSEASSRRWERLGERKLFFTGQEGPDVAHLQEKLSVFGFLPKASVTGRFDEGTKEALRDFQHRFGIYVDGVAGSVTAMVLQFLSTIEYHPTAFEEPRPGPLSLRNGPVERPCKSQRLRPRNAPRLSQRAPTSDPSQRFQQWTQTTRSP